MERGDDVKEMAIVGEERWKDEARVFVARGLRKTKIEYFRPSTLKAAEAWVRA